MSRKAEQVRGAVVTLTRAGHSNQDIAEICNVPKQTVSKIKSEFDAFVQGGGDPDNFDVRVEARSRRSDTHPEELSARVKASVDADPGQSIRGIARALDVSHTLVGKIVHEELGLTSYALRRGQILTQANREARVERARALLNFLKAPKERTGGGANRLIFFSDEKNFQQDQVVNRRNHRWLCADPSEVPIVSRTKFPAHVMVLGVISSEGDVMPPHFFDQGLKVNTDVYVHVLKHVVKPWMDQIAGERTYTFQQDGAPAHTSKRAQEWLQENVPWVWSKEMWPPNSPDLNPLDFFFWSVIEEMSNRTPHSNINSLKRAIERAFDEIDRGTVKRACASFRGRLERCVANNGDFFE